MSCHSEIWIFLLGISAFRNLEFGFPPFGTSLHITTWNLDFRPLEFYYVPHFWVLTFDFCLPALPAPPCAATISAAATKTTKSAAITTAAKTAIAVPAPAAKATAK